jgi:hypothetical protein
MVQVVRQSTWLRIGKTPMSELFSFAISKTPMIKIFATTGVF